VVRLSCCVLVAEVKVLFVKPEEERDKEVINILLYYFLVSV